MTGCNRPYRWLSWEEEILLQNRCRLTITELLSRINERRIAEGLPPRTAKSLHGWSNRRRIPLVYWRSDAYTALELARLLGCARGCIERPCKKGLLEFRRGDRRSYLVTLGQLTDCLRHHPEVAAAWPHRAIDRLADLLEDPGLIAQIKSCRRINRVRHRDGREWDSIRSAARDLGVFKDTIKVWAGLPDPPLTIGA